MGFKHLGSPIRLRHKAVKNRIVFGAHTANYAFYEGRKVGREI